MPRVVLASLLFILIAAAGYSMRTVFVEGRQHSAIAASPATNNATPLATTIVSSLSSLPYQSSDPKNLFSAFTRMGEHFQDLFWPLVASAQIPDPDPGCPPGALRLGRTCTLQHSICKGSQCIIVPEAGENECVGDGDCPPQTHRACIRDGLGPQCTVVRGPGPDECVFDGDCEGGGGKKTLPRGGRTCADRDGDGRVETCVVGGGGDISCIDDDDCTNRRHTECAGGSTPQCVIKQGPGINECGKPWKPNDEECSCPDLPPSDDTCGEYDLNGNPLGQNFGDPICSYSRTRLRNLLEELDPTYAHRWYCQIIPCESAWNPNTFGCAGNWQRDWQCSDPFAPSGAWGLFQMDCHLRPNNWPCSPVNNNDVNDVIWCKQVQNAIAYNRDIGNSFAYWACRDHAYYC